MINRCLNGQIHIGRLLTALLILLLCMIFAGCGEEVKQVYNVELVEEESEEAVTKEDVNKEPSDEGLNDEEAYEEASDEEALGEGSGNKLPERLEQEDIETETDGDDESGVVMHDGKIVVDVVMFLGQSNMSGEGGDKTLAPVVPEGHGYEFRAISDPTRLYPIAEPFGENESYIGGICDLPGAKKGSLVSAFANEYYKETGIPIVAVSASRGASTTEMWLTPGFQYDLKERYARVIVWLEASGYYIRNRYAVWYQGESDAINNVTTQQYQTNMDDIVRPLFIGGLNRVFIITPGRTLSIKNYFDPIINEQLRMCKTSGYYALGTSVLSAVSAEYMTDEIHYGQYALNLVGIETAKSAAYLSNYKKERVDYDYENQEVFIPDGNDYTGNEECEPIDLSDIKIYTENYDYE